ncbi:MAG: aminoglycoside phosphotransferase family protein [Chloroflexales bacterium]|nr:aminoglycoside phosphotransferase family protein [Chloroflexales bacterium]
MPDSLLAVLDYLDATQPQAAQSWREWRIAPIVGGANNLLYHVANDRAACAVKFTICDERNRAKREYDALRALHHAGLRLAPQPIWLDLQRYRQPVIVQSWLDGAVLSAAPATAADWVALLNHYCAIHSLTPARTTIALAEAHLNIASGAAGKALICQHVAKLPPNARPASLQALLAWIDRWTPPAWSTPPRALCRADPNWRNFIRRTDDWASVDWENSGWGDPAFELADLMVHPTYEHIPLARWEQLITAYAEQRGDPSAVVRIQTYITIMLVWWVVRIARYLYEAPRGLDPRLVRRPANWREEKEQQYAQFVARAEAHIATLHI